MVGGSGFGMNAKYPLGVRKTRPGDELEKSLGSMRQNPQIRISSVVILYPKCK
jgi:hypothetical protein